MIDPRAPSSFEPAAAPARTRYGRRLAWAGLAILVLLGIVAYALSTLALALPAARADIESRLGRLLGAPVMVDGTAEFSLLPNPRVTLSGVRAVAGQGSQALQLDVDVVEADFDLFDALTGTADIKRVTLIRPELGPAAPLPAASSAPPSSSPADAAADAARPAEPAATDQDCLRALLIRFEGLKELRMREGLIRLPGMRGGVSSADLDFRWSEDMPAAIEGSFVWNGQPSAVQGRLDRPFAFFNGESSPLQLLLSSPSGEAGFTGEGSGGENLRLTGGLRLTTPSLSRAARWLGESSLPDFGAFSIDTRIDLSGERLNFGSVDLDLGGNRARGAMEMQFASRSPLRSLSGTLAFQSLDFTRFVQALAPMPRNVLDLQRPIRADFPDDLALDLRLSAEKARLGSLQASEVAATVKMAGGTGTLDVGDMAAMGGRGGMRLSVGLATGRPMLDANLRLAGVRLGDLAALSSVPLPFGSGAADLDLTVKGPAANWGEILTANRSTMELRARDGTLHGFGPGLMRSPGRHEVDLVADASAQGFQSLQVFARGTGLRLHLDRLDLSTVEGESAAHGVVDLRTHEVKIGGRSAAPQVEASGEPGGTFTSSQPVSFTISGEWPRPSMTVSAPTAPM